MKNISKIILAVIIVFITISCERKKESNANEEKTAVEGLLKKFPMLDKDFVLVRKAVLDSMSISLFRSRNEVYDELLIFEKKGKYYAMPFFSNMYSDYWNFQNDNQPRLFPSTNSSFNKEFSELIADLKITPAEFDLVINELMLSVLHAENNIEGKAGCLSNNSYRTYRVDKYKIEESDSCLKRTNEIFDQISKESNVNLRRFQYFFDKSNGRIYKIENEAKNNNELKIKIESYRVDCYSYKINI